MTYWKRVGLSIMLVGIVGLLALVIDLQAEPSYLYLIPAGVWVLGQLLFIGLPEGK